MCRRRLANRLKRNASPDVAAEYHRRPVCFFGAHRFEVLLDGGKLIALNLSVHVLGDIYDR